MFLYVIVQYLAMWPLFIELIVRFFCKNSTGKTQGISF